MAERELVGQRVVRIDSLAKATGEARYTADLTLPRMLHAKGLRSPHAHAKILNINTTKAEKLPGVKAVVTGKDARKALGISLEIIDQIKGGARNFQRIC